MANDSRAFVISNGDTPEHTAPEKLTVLVVEPMKEPYVKEIAPDLHGLQAEVGGNIAASYHFDDPVGLMLNDEGKLIGLDLNCSLWDEHGEIYDICGRHLPGSGPEAGEFCVPAPGHDSEVYQAIQATGAVRQHQRADCVCPREAGKPRTSLPCRRSPRSWATYEPEQEMASGMGLLPGRERQAPVQQALQRMRPSLQTEFADGDGAPAFYFCKERLYPISVFSINPVS